LQNITNKLIKKNKNMKKTPSAYANAVLNYNLTTIFNIPYLRGEVRSVEWNEFRMSTAV